MRTVIPKAQVKNFQLPKMEIMSSGSQDCPGCGVSLAMRYALKAVGRKTVLVVPACFYSLLEGAFKKSAIQAPVFYGDDETAAEVASRVREDLDLEAKTDVGVVAWVGDGQGGGVERQSLIAAIERNENFIYIYVDSLANDIAEARGPKTQARKSLVEIMTAHGVAYAATATVAYPRDFVSKFKKARRIKGSRLLHVFAPCPPALKIPEHLSVHIARLAVQTRIFPLYEVEGQESYTISTIPEKLPVQEFLRPQGRFRNLTKRQVEIIQRRVRTRWEWLVKKAEG